MIAHLERLYGSPPVTDAESLLRLNVLKDDFLVPVDQTFNGLVVTSGYRSPELQATMPASRRAKGLSQHELCEAVDFVPQAASVWDVYEWIYRNSPWWQLIIYINRGSANEIHVSTKSRVETIVKKALINRDGTWLPFESILA